MRRQKTQKDRNIEKIFELLGLITAIFGGYLFLCIASYNPRDNSLLYLDSTQNLTRNIVGYYGNQLSSILYALFGFSSYFLPLLIILVSYRLFFTNKIYFWIHKVLSSIIAMVSFSAFLHLFISLVANPEGKVIYASEEILAGGAIGEQVGMFLVHYLGVAGSISALIILLLISSFVLFGIYSIKSISIDIYNAMVLFIKKLYGFFSLILCILKRPFIYLFNRARYSLSGYRKEVREENEDLSDKIDRLLNEDEGIDFTITSDEMNENPGKIPKTKTITGHSACGKKGGAKTRTRHLPNNEEIENLKVPKPDINIIISQNRDIISDKEFERNKYSTSENNYVLPPLSFMETYPGIDRESNREIYRKQSRELESKLFEHRISGNVIDVKPGPVVTRYDFKIAPSIKISSIKNLEEDISLALGVSSIRIIPVPENRSLGLEIPNDSKLREIIGLKDIIQSNQFINKYKIPIALGKDIAGLPIVADLSQMPHLLIGGATGSGKSVCLNSLLISLLYRFSPEELQLILIDPKQIEFGLYEDLPHLIAPVITDPDKSLNVLKWAVSKMEECYNDIAAQRVRNVYEYNSEIRNMQSQGVLEDEIPQLMPYRVIVIDEFGDLMLTSKGNNLDECILRLAQKARAVGIHLIMATQRPSVDVITGLIKANLRARIAFRVTQGIDSKTILDRIGAEKLLGKGDMFYRPPDNDFLKRVHGAYISTNEIKKIVEFIKEQRQPDYDEAILTAEEEESDLVDEIMEKEEDALYPKAVDLVVRNKMASVSMLQRRLKIGHARASRMIDMMEYDSVVGPFVGSKMREVYLTENLLRSWLSFGKSREKLREITAGLM